MLAPSGRSISASVPPQSFSASLGLKERLQGAQNHGIYEEIRALASYGKKTPSLSSSVTGSSLLSPDTSLSSLSPESLSGLKLIQVGEGEHIFAVQGSELQARMTQGVLLNKQKEIQEFCLNPDAASEDLVEAMRELVATCTALATHPYLIITPPLANADMPEAKEAEYLVASSGKFVTLGKIMEEFRGEKNLKIGIVVENAKTVELLEGFIRGKGIKVRRTDGAGVRENQVVDPRTGPTVTIVIGGKAGFNAIVVTASSDAS